MSSKPESENSTPDLRPENSSHPRIVFFDGVCHLCNGFVDHLISQDPEHRLHFAPLQGETARKLLSPQQIDGGSVILWNRGKILSHSAAALGAAAELGGVYRGLKVLLWIPAFLRDFIYNIIARNRYKWFGEREFCRLPRPEERAYLLP